MKQVLRIIFLFTSLILFRGAINAQVYNGSGGSITNDSVPNFFSQTVTIGNNYIDTNFGVYGVVVNISHPNVSDLNIFLVSPNGITVELSTKNGGSGDNYTNCIFTNNTTNKIVNASAPFTGSFKPEASLSAVNTGQNPNGIWKLMIFDSKKSSDAGSLLGWSLIFSSNPSKPFPFINSNLPIMWMNTFNQGIPDASRVNARMCIVSNDTSLNKIADTTRFYTHRITIETRGSSSQTFPKKPYSFSTVDGTGLDSNTSLLGMPPEHDWILNATYNDKSLMRDVLTYELAKRTGRYATRYRYFELFINGNYEGIYILMEKIKRDVNRVDISKLKIEDTSGVNLTGGYIIKIDKTTGNNNGGWTDTFPTYPGSPNRVYFQYDYPNGPDMAPQQLNYIKNYIYTFENALYGSQMSDTNGYRKYADMNSFIDFSIMNEISKNVDGYRLSSYLFKNKDNHGGKLVMGPIWDFNLAWNNADYGNSSDPTGWEIDLSATAPFWWKRFRQDTTYVRAFYCRWNELRQKTLSFNQISNFLDSTYSYLKDAAVRNEQRWPVLGLYVWPNPQPLSYTREDEITALKNWIYNRFTWIDDQMVGGCNTVTACKPRVGIAADKTTTCKFQPVKLYADGIGTIYNWSPATGLNTTSGRNVIAILDTTRTYRVVMQTSNGCTDTNYITINVLPLPAKSITGNTSICKGYSTQLTAASGAVFYRWTPTASLDTGFGITVKASPSLTTTYKMFARNATGCIDSSFITVVVNQNSVVKITPSSDSTCLNKPLTLVASGASTYRWLPVPGLNDSVGATVVVNPPSPTLYKVIGTNAQGCIDTAEFMLNYYSAAPLKIQATDTQICIGESTQLTAGGGSNYSWLPANGFTGSSANSITVSPATTTTYRLAGINIHGCADTTSIKIEVNNYPTVSVTALDTSLCAGEQTTLTATGGLVYNWLPAPGLLGGFATVASVKPTTTTTYYVVGTNAGGCADTAQITINVYPMPVAKISGSNYLCKGQGITLTASGGLNYEWYPSLGLNATNTAIVIASPVNSTVYHAIAISNNQCRDTAEISITVNDTPTVSISPSAPSINKGQTVILTASGAQNYQWTPSVGLNTTSGSVVIASPIVNTTYSVLATDSNTCSVTKTVTVNVTTNGINTQQWNNQTFAVYPDPMHDQLTIQSFIEPKEIAKSIYSICDMSGKEIITGKLSATTHINTSALSNGVYLLKINHEDGVQWVKRVVKN